jgi:hypothetical protein
MVAILADRHVRSTKRLNVAARKAPADAVEAAAEALGTLAAHRERSAFVTWLLHAVAAHDLSNVEDLVDVLERPETLADLRRRDPLAAPRLRGLRAKRQLLEAEGGIVSGRELAKAIGITRQAVDKRRLAGTLIGIDLGKRGYAYPVWQVGLDGLDTVLATLEACDPWTQALFMLSPDSWLNGETPLAVLRRGEREAVLTAARLYGEQTAT